MAHEWWGYWDCIYPSFVYVSLKEFGVVGSDTYTWGIKDFHKFWSGSLAKRSLAKRPWACQCNKLHSTICIVLLSEFVSQNAWLQQDLCFRTVVLEKILESSLDCKIKPVNPKESTLNTHCKNQCWSWNSNNLATWCNEPIHWKKILMLGKIEIRKIRGQQRVR